MKVLVTGASGFLGGSLVSRLLASGERDLRCFVRPGSRRDHLQALAAQYPHARVEIFEGTLNTVDGATAALAEVGLVHHLAATMAGAAADIFSGTVVTSRNLLQAAVASQPQPRIVLVSSFGVYGPATQPRGSVVDEDMPLERHPEQRDLYSQAKLRQEKLFTEYRRQHEFPLTVMRPGVIYGPYGPAISGRVGLNVFGVFLSLGGRNRLPLTYVDNCADALVLAGRRPQAVDAVFNVVDDDLPTCDAFLEQYRRKVKPMRTLRLPYPALLALSHLVERYHKFSRGQLPPIFTPYKTATTWGGNRFDNTRLRQLGWRPLVSMQEGLRRTFEWLASQQAGRAG